MAEDPYGDSNETFTCIPSRFNASIPIPDLMNLANHVNNLVYFEGAIESPDLQDAYTTNSLAS